MFVEISRMMMSFITSQIGSGGAVGARRTKALAERLLEHFRKLCRPESCWNPTLSAEKNGKDGARKSTAKAKML
jgi:hypothetical protein